MNKSIRKFQEAAFTTATLSSWRYEEPTPILFECPTCVKTFTTYQALINHKNEERKENPAYYKER